MAVSQNGGLAQVIYGRFFPRQSSLWIGALVEIDLPVQRNQAARQRWTCWAKAVLSKAAEGHTR